MVGIFVQAKLTVAVDYEAARIIPAQMSRSLPDEFRRYSFFLLACHVDLCLIHVV